MEIFSAKRGHLKFAIQSQEFFRTLQRYYSNAYMDAYKQAAINLFLGYFEPHQGKPALWEIESVAVLGDNASKLIKKARSAGSIIQKSVTPMSSNGQNGLLNSSFTDSKNELQSPNCSSDSVNEIPSASKSRYTPTVPHIKHASSEASELDYCNGSGDSNFLDIDWLSSSDNERSTTISTPDVNVSTDNVATGVSSGRTEDHAAEIQAQGISEHFVQWVDQGEAFWY
ncbi:hypothetical protein GUJ93_ZPchr0006g44054 [Zizania palustris]|uniref:Uncharacterized protein n=1 Tax=Zizania palustris TaxID=103762 RepID=A0A8J5SNH8_ZIZPA|nr:hypothetical protein GUJ93_ZPchr0006g44054 [Zizania palustris]